MRPRLLHLGYQLRVNAEHGAALASMRPRLLHLGYLPRSRRRTRNLNALQ